MFLFPIKWSSFFLLLFILPILFLLGFLNIISFSLEKLGLSAETAFLILFLSLMGSAINIPLGRKKVIYTEKHSTLLPFFRKAQAKTKIEGLAINLGGAIIPLALSLYLLTKVPIGPVAAATLLMIVISKLLARVVPGRGIKIPVFVPPLFSALFAFIFVPGFVAPAAFIMGTLGVLIGADILNLKRVAELGGEIIVIGGAGVLDGIYLVGIVSVLLTGL